MLKDGTLPPGMKFEDDNINRYDPRIDPKGLDKGQMPNIGKFTGAVQNWIQSSDAYSKELAKKKMN